MCVVWPEAVLGNDKEYHNEHTQVGLSQVVIYFINERDNKQLCTKDQHSRQKWKQRNIHTGIKKPSQCLGILFTALHKSILE